MDMWWEYYLGKTLQHGKLEDHPPNHDIISLFSSYLPLSKYKKILEIGAGAGVDMDVLVKMGYVVSGIDLLDVNIEYAKNFVGVQIDKIDMHNIESADETFDGILTIQTFEHALSPFIVASEMYRVLRCEGRVFLDTPDANDESMYQLWHPSILHPKQLIKLFTNVGFTLVKDLSRKHRTQIVFEAVK